MGTSLAVQWLRCRDSIAGGAGLNPGQGTKSPHATDHGQKKEKDNVMIGMETGVMWPQAKECWKPPETGEDRE